MELNVSEIVIFSKDAHRVGDLHLRLILEKFLESQSG